MRNIWFSMARAVDYKGFEDDEEIQALRKRFPYGKQFNLDSLERLEKKTVYINPLAPFGPGINREELEKIQAKQKELDESYND